MTELSGLTLVPSTKAERIYKVTISDEVRKSMVAGSWIRRMFEEAVALKQRYGEENVFDLSLGNPVMEPPPDFKHRLRTLAENPIPGMHRYMENAGYTETRAAVATQLSLETGLKFTLDEIIMTCGAAGALNVVLKTILNQGDEVIIFAPYFAEYINYISNHGGVVKVLPTDEQFMLKLDVLEAAIGAKTKAVIINSPNNPSGAVYDENLIHRLGKLLLEKEALYGTQICLISDEAYRRIIYDGLEYPPVGPHYSQSIVVTSHSKDLALPGERIGYIAVHPDCSQREELVDGLIYCNRTLGFVNAPAMMQHVVRHLQQVTVPVGEYQKKRDFLYDHLIGMGYSVIKPRGAFYMFPKSPLEDDVTFVKKLQQWNVLTVPGRGFGAPGYFRISYCVDDRTLEGSLYGFQKAAQEFNLC
ncbi:pyridoxal phosphate-dependent aminotransferase [Chloroflexota bacterium]